MTGPRKVSHRLCDFDSSVAAVRAVSRFLRGRDFPGLGVGPGSAKLADFASGLPAGLRRRAFVAGGYLQGTPPAQASALTSEDLAAWTAAQYGPGPYPAVFIGSGSGAAVHAAAALRAPVLPQTFLIPVRARLDPDRPQEAMEAGRALGRRMVEADPALSLSHMHDPNQDRAMIVRFMYFRVKRLRLGAVLERFLRENLAPGGTVFILDCTIQWPVTALGERHRFQFGALGGIPAREYVEGSERVARFLAEQGADVRAWRAPAPDGTYPEAEWGYDDALTADVSALAAAEGYRLRRITVAEPERLSPLVAELYRWWYQRRGLPADHLLTETYNQWEPYWALRSGTVPFWLHFPTEPSRDRLEEYLRSARTYERIDVNLFANGLRSVGQLPVEQWGELARRYADGAGGTIGVDEDAYPTDLGSTLRYQPALAALGRRFPLPDPLALEELDTFLDLARGTDAHRPVRIEDVDTRAG